MGEGGVRQEASPSFTFSSGSIAAPPDRPLQKTLAKELRSSTGAEQWEREREHVNGCMRGVVENG